MPRLFPVLALLACHAPDDSALSWSYPLDDVLTFADVQALGTHNSYHVMTTEGVDEWAYSHDPLDVQLGAQGVRQLELDVYWEPDAAAFSVQHIPLLDEGTTCPWLADCLDVVKAWSDRNPAHHPLFVLIEFKEDVGEADAVAQVDALDAAIRAVWPDDRLITPDLVTGDHPDLATALEADGWPALGALRGRALFVVHESGHERDALLRGADDLAGRALFPDAMDDVDAPWAAVHSVNDPIGGAETIAQLVDRHHLVRTIADPDHDAILAGDTSRAEAAYASGAHFVSTDYPAAVDGVPYVVAIPGGTPSRCNPRHAPSACTSQAVEDPAFIGP